MVILDITRDEAVALMATFALPMKAPASFVIQIIAIAL